MKKFEEELYSEVPCKFGVTKEAEYKQSILIKHFGDWVSPEAHQAEIEKIELQNLKYREEIVRMQKSLRKKNKAIKELNGAVKKNKARLKECEDFSCDANNQAAHEYILKCEAEEERAELKRENQRLRAENLAVKTLVENAKKENAKKQQSEIPEVPQFVADWLDRKPLYAINGSIPVEIIEWSQKQTGYVDLGMNISHLLKLKVNGYTVAKEKRFYLKNKLTGDCLARCLSRASSGLYVEVTEKWLTRKEQTSYQLSFTQQEIASMETGSYEQIEVQE